MVGGSIKSYLLKRVSTVRIRPGAPEDYDGVARVAPFLVCGSCRRIRTVGTRVTHFPAGGVFESARGHQRNIEPGTAMVPGSSGLRAGFGPSTPASPISPRGSFRIRPGAPEICRARYHHGAGLFWFKGMPWFSLLQMKKAPICRGSKRAQLSECICVSSRCGQRLDD